MKKLKLEHYNVKDAEILTREQLQKITGGDSGSGGTAGCAETGLLCHVKEDGTAYRCYTEGNECCCGHSDYDHKCRK